ncbi:MFS transporter [Brevibacterium sp. FAM 24638]|uniref:MFS transporter n=1 Tax=Brevibacterium sp. FAM 24638 TaxID=3415681 RepID=UPI003C7BC130
MQRSTLWLSALFIATLAIGTDEFVIAGVLTTVSDDLSVTAGRAGQLVTAFALSFALSAPALAVWLDRHPRRTVLLGGLATFALTNIGCAVAPDFTTLLVLRVSAGVSAAAVSTTAFAAAAEGAPEGRQGTYLSVVAAGLTVALFSGVPVGTWIAGAVSWRSTFAFIALAAFVAAMMSLTLPRLPGSPSDTLSLVVRLAPLRTMGVLRMVAAIFFCGAGGLMFYTYLGPIAWHTIGDDDPLPLLLLIVGLVGVISVIAGGRLTDSIGPRRARLAIIGGHAAALILNGILVLAGAPMWAFALGIGVWSVFAWALNPPMQASTIAAAPTAAMTAVSLNISGLYLGTALAGALGGVTLDRFGPTALPFIGAAALVAAWLLAAPHIKEPTSAALPRCRAGEALT